MRTRLPETVLAVALALGATHVHARALDPLVQRSAADRVNVMWSDKDAVDVFVAERQDAGLAAARLVSAADRDGQAQVVVPAGSRPYFLLRDKRDGSVVEVAERAIPLQQGSNFRDLGGYEGAAGNHVRWGLIYRSGATPLLTDADRQAIAGLGLRNMIDLRSDEERQIAPSRIDGVPYAAIGYSMVDLLQQTAVQKDLGAAYRNFPNMLAPQLRLLFADLKRGDGPIVYNCSAGQDRTGFATAMVLSALGVPRETILKDYHLSTELRRPEFEMPPVNPDAFPGNKVAPFFAHYHQQGSVAKPQPLYDQQGRSLLLSAFDEIDHKWGSVDAYLDQEIGVSKADLAGLRARYLQ